MAAKRAVPKHASTRGASVDTVSEFLRELKHPLKPALEVVLETIRGASPGIAAGIKWNAPSFFLPETGRFFATVNIHGTAKTKDCVLLVLHQDAKARAGSAAGIAIKDPHRLLDWLAKNRCVVRFTDLKDAKGKAAALQEIVRQWIAHL